jgi:PAS domain S-box-containing protein
MREQEARSLANSLSETELYRIQVRDAANYAMFMVDHAGTILTWNSGVEKLLGYTEEEWVGQHASIIFTPADKCREVCDSEMALALEAGTATDIRWHRRKDGSELFAHGFMTAVRDDNGNFIGFSKILSDETAHKKIQDALTESNSALEQFSYVVSHDLQEPLRTTSAYAQLLSLRYKGKLDEDADQFLKFIVDGAKRMAGLIQDLLDFARVTADEERLCSVALDEDLEATLTHLQQAVDESEATVTHGPLPTLAVDRGQMVRLFQNLVGNALKYRAAGQRPLVHVYAEDRDNEWLISVKDNGIGFDPAHAASIFTPFRRLHSQDEYPGSGVGLAICRKIVEGHGGRIWADSKPGEGSIFSFTLPKEGKSVRKT